MFFGILSRCPIAVSDMVRIALLILVILLVAAGSSTAGDRVAFIVGNRDYQRLTKLRNTLNDAEALKQVLEARLGFKVIYAPDSHADDMKAKTEEFGLAATEADIALFYYAGHAVEFNEANFLMPVDFNDTSRASYVNQTTRLDDLLMITQLVRAKAKVLVVDACRANPFADEQVRGGVSLKLSRLRALSTNTIVVFSTQPGQLAEDGQGRHSPFAEALLATVETPGIDVVSMFQSVAATVAKSTAGRQTPWLDQNFIEGQSIYLGTRTGEACDPADKEADRAMCKALVRGNANGLSMQAYLSCYPTGLCAANIAALVALQKDDDEQEPEVDVANSAVTVTMTRGAANPYRPKSYWSHNNSLISLADNGNDRIFYYEKPRPGMVEAGVTPGTILFKGQFSRKKMRYSGEAYLFSRKCGPIAYAMEGKVSADYRHVELRGRRPIRDASCRSTGSRAETLQFSFISIDRPR
jgi:uncharacterized caspase-like protein